MLVTTRWSHHPGKRQPPTHDDWVLSGLRGTSRGVVQLANGFVRDKLRIQDLAANSVTGPADTPLGYLSGRLSGLMAGADGGASTATTSQSRPTGRGRRSATNPRITDGPTLEVDNDRAVVAAVVELPSWPSTRTVVLEPLVVVDGGVERTDELNDRPEVLGWASLEDDTYVSGAELVANRASSRTWRVTVTSVPDAVLRLRLRTLDEDDG